MLPVVGQAAAVGLTLYFICTNGVHIRARDPGVGGVVFSLMIAGRRLSGDVLGA